jgi:hypothetical protein
MNPMVKYFDLTVAILTSVAEPHHFYAAPAAAPPAAAAPAAAPTLLYSKAKFLKRPKVLNTC